MSLLKYSALFLLAVVLAFSPFAQAYASGANMPRIGIFIFKLDDIYINSVAKHIEENLKGKAELTIFDAKNDQTLQTEQLIEYLKKDVDAVGINLVDVKESQSIIHLIREKNIPVIFFNKEPHINFLKTYEKARYVGTNADQSGIIQGEIIARLWKENPQFDRNDDGVCQFIMLQGGIDNPEALSRTRLSVQKARELGVFMQQLGDTLICDWDARCASNATKLAFSIYSDQIDFVISNNDDMAIGAIESLQYFGLNTKNGVTIPVVGIDAISKAKDAIAKGIMHGTVLQDSNNMADAISGMLLNALAGKPFLQDLPYSWDDSGISVRIPYKAYEK